jgi:uncharacterized coiled-coil protein SlyX
MTQAVDNDRLDRIEQTLEKLSINAVESETRFDRIENKLDKLTTDVEKWNDRFANYQQATQWVVQLAFGLIASATVTVIITAVLKK